MTDINDPREEIVAQLDRMARTVQKRWRSGCIGGPHAGIRW
jgi:hypothetical protein